MLFTVRFVSISELFLHYCACCFFVLFVKAKRVYVGRAVISPHTAWILNLRVGYRIRILPVPNICINVRITLTFQAKLYNIIFHTLEDVSRVVSTTHNIKWVNCSYLFNLEPDIRRCCCLNAHFVPSNSDLKKKKIGAKQQLQFTIFGYIKGVCGTTL